MTDADKDGQKAKLESRTSGVIGAVAFTIFVLIVIWFIYRERETDVPPLVDGFRFFATARTNDGPGTVFRVNDQGVWQEVAELGVTPSIGPMVAPEIKVERKLSASAALTLAGNRSYSLSGDRSYLVELVLRNAVHERVSDDALAAPLAKWKQQFGVGLPGWRYFVIRETIAARNIHYVLTTIDKDSGEAGAAAAAELAEMNAGGNIEAGGTLTLNSDTPEPLRLLYKAEEIILGKAATNVAEKSLDQSIAPELASTPQDSTKKSVMILRSIFREDGVLTAMTTHLEKSGYRVQGEPQDGPWITQAVDLAGKQPDVLVVHWHALRSNKVRQPDAEQVMLEGLKAFLCKSSKTRIVLFSRSFGTVDGDAAVLRAAQRVAGTDSAAAAQYTNLVASIKLLAWPTKKPDLALLGDSIALAVDAKPATGVCR